MHVCGEGQLVSVVCSAQEMYCDWIQGRLVAREEGTVSTRVRGDWIQMYGEQYRLVAREECTVSRGVW